MSSFISCKNKDCSYYFASYFYYQLIYWLFFTFMTSDGKKKNKKCSPESINVSFKSTKSQRYLVSPHRGLRKTENIHICEAGTCKSFDTLAWKILGSWICLFPVFMLIWEWYQAASSLSLAKNKKKSQTIPLRIDYKALQETTVFLTHIGVLSC